jgi:hypothetical protein
MRNDARPVGVEAHDQSPVARDHVPGSTALPDDDRDSVTHDRQSHIINEDAERDVRGAGNNDPTMPTGDAALNTKI